MHQMRGELGFFCLRTFLQSAYPKRFPSYVSCVNLCRSTRGCKIGDGSIVSWTAWFLYFIGGFFLCCSPKHDPICCQDDKDDEPKVVEQPAPVATSPPMVNEDVEIGAEDPPEGSTTKLQDPPDGSTTKPQVY
jgi:hypothetical protein